MRDDEQLEPVLRDHGLRLTRPRLLVWEMLGAAEHHLTAEELAVRVHEVDEGVNVASVYRSLSLFAELGLARESRLGQDNAARWERAHPDEHFHLVCRVCGSVTHHRGDLVEQVRAHLSEGHAFEAESVDLVVTGRCDRCGG